MGKLFYYVSPCSIIWYWPKGDDTLWLRKQWRPGGK